MFTAQRSLLLEALTSHSGKYRILLSEAKIDSAGGEELGTQDLKLTTPQLEIRRFWCRTTSENLRLNLWHFVSRLDLETESHLYQCTLIDHQICLCGNIQVKGSKLVHIIRLRSDLARCCSQFFWVFHYTVIAKLSSEHHALCAHDSWTKTGQPEREQRSTSCFWLLQQSPTSHTATKSLYTANTGNLTSYRSKSS